MVKLLTLVFCLGIVKFFGNSLLYSGTDRVLSMYPGYLGLLFGMLSDEDLNTQRIAVETLGIIGKTAEGKLLLAERGIKR